MSLTSSNHPCPSGGYRVVEISLRFADLNSKKHGKIYVNLWIHPDRKLRTRVVNTRGGLKPVWEERFVFSVSENFLCTANTTIVSFEIYRARKLFHDSLVGSGQCDLKSLFNKTEDEEEFKVEKYVVYDTEVEFSDDGKEDSTYELYSEDGEIVEENQPPEELKASATVQVSKGLNSKGTLSFNVAMWKGFINCVGDSKWSNVAMSYADFMGQQEVIVKEKKMKKGTWLCFAGYQS